MLWWILSAFFALCFMFSMTKELRRFRNGIYLLLSMMFSFIGLALTHQHNEFIIFFVQFSIFLIAPISLLILSLGLIGNGIVMVKKEGLKVMNLLSAYFGIGIITFMVLVYLTLTIANVSNWLLYILLLFIMMMLYSGFIFMAFLLYSLVYRILPKNSHCDYIIIHGAGLLDGHRVSNLLALRLNKGISIYNKGGNKARIIVSGGKGGDETVSEAFAMKRYLLEKGIDESFIIMEEKSTSTFENLSFSKNIMDALSGQYTCIFVTNDYHVFRTSTYARKLKLKAQGVGCRTAMYYLPSAFIREYLAVLWQYRFNFIIIIGLWLIFLGISMGLF